MLGAIFGLCGDLGVTTNVICDYFREKSSLNLQILYPSFKLTIKSATVVRAHITLLASSHKFAIMPLCILREDFRCTIQMQKSRPKYRNRSPHLVWSFKIVYLTPNDTEIMYNFSEGV